ncbi:MAG: glucosaminidase domain-containing protein [Gammaproteobacteria bacterium]
MTIENKTAIYHDMSGFNDLRRVAREDPDAALREVAEQFEAIFMKMMLKSMREASMGNSLFDSDQSQMYQDMFDNQLSVNLSQGNSNGLADILVRQLGGTVTSKNENDLTMTAKTNTIGETKQERFINTIRPYAEKAAKELNTRPEVLIAQAALETGWGQGIQRHPDGSSGFNMFNIKANHNWQGPIVSKYTLEYKNGMATREPANFRAYTSLNESFNDYVNYLKDNPRYQQALKSAQDPVTYIQELSKSGYATDPAYADKITTIMSRDVSPKFDVSPESDNGDTN